MYDVNEVKYTYIIVKIEVSERSGFKKSVDLKLALVRRVYCIIKVG